MSYRIRRKTISTTFTVQGQLCKLFLEPTHEYAPGFWQWNVGFAVGKSRRQLNDWYWRRNNKRRRKLVNQFTGRSGIAAIAKGFDNLLLMRWNLAPGDCLVLDCTSGDPDSQLKAWKRWQRNHQDCLIDEENKKFYWYRPPYSTDQIYQFFKIKPVTPSDPRANCLGDRYFDCYSVDLKAHDTVESTVQKILLSSLDQQ